MSGRLTCPACATEALAGSEFCEECGAALAAAAAPGGDPRLRCPGCGAGPGAVDGDGFCAECGIRRVAPWRDHVEDALSARAAGVSDIGKSYHENQDFFTLGAAATGELVAVVCDGVSRSQNPQQGSKVACDAALASIIADLAAGAGVEPPNAILTRAMQRAQEAICQVPFKRGLAEDGELLPPAQATAVGALVKGRRVTIGWLGDSRAYWVGEQGARQLTTDHSWVNEVVAAGEMTREEAQGDGRAHGIVRSLGADLDGGNPGAEPDAVTLNLVEPGILLVVTDGFHGTADERTITRLVQEPPAGLDALGLARRLVEHARAAGGKDNITVVAIRL